MKPRGYRRPAAAVPGLIRKGYHYRHRGRNCLPPSEKAILQHLLGASHRFSLWGVDPALRYLFFNETHRQLVASFWSREPRIGEKVLDGVTNDEFKNHSAALYGRAFSGEGVSAEATVQDSEGVERTFHYVLTPLGNTRSHQSSGVLVVSVETTIERRQEAALRKAQIDRDFLLHDLDHKVKNDIQGLLSALASEMEDVKNAEASTLFGTTLTRLGTLADLYDLSVSSGSAGRSSLPNHLGVIVSSFTSDGTHATSPHIRRQFVHMSLPSIRAMAVAQLLWELLNALNLPTGPQAPEIYLRLERQGSDKGCLSLSLTPEEEPVQLPERLLDGLLSEAQATLDVEETREARRILLRFPL